ncbi:MAG: hypothetical protein CMJ83_11165 [Planctomycetes bacterium]|jgi:hypothetical protein|nr:hypothetical protein [Planctomycetota bacterium]
MRGRSVILKAHYVRLAERPRPLGHPNADPHADVAPGARDTREGDIEIALVRNGDLVESIQVVCRCGRTTEVECLYDALVTEGALTPDPGSPGESR